MDRFARWFVISALGYLLIGGALGTWMVHVPDTRGSYRWPHLHLMVLGFVVMMIFGVAYHVLPRFSGNVLWSQKLGWVHFVAAQLGLLGMIGSWVMHAQSAFAEGSAWVTVLTASSDLEYLGMWLFVVNIAMSLRHKPKPAWLPPAPAAVGQPQGVAR
ncbi:MAG: hypothetical protein AAB434_04190 [Planctomycetota bacterium]